jgi:alpha-tubulin suppressor-like RCC1 family protein
MGNRDFGPMVDLQDKKVIELRARNDYSIGITADGDVWVFGSSFEKSGLVGRFSNFLSASCGTKHMAIMTKSGELFMMGTNDKKELPIDEAMYRHDFIKSNITSGKAIRAGCGDSFTIVYFAEHTSDRQRQKMHALIDKEQLCDVTIRVHSLY